jgi:predicted dehydrogenase
MNIAVIGFGFMGMTHAMSILNNPGLRLNAIVDKNPGNIRKNLDEQIGNFSTGSMDAEELSSTGIYSDLATCLKNEKIEACVIAVHTDLHYEITQMALNAGLHAFLEKPFCIDVSEGERLIALAREKNLLLMIGHVVRFMPAYVKLKNWIDNQEFGELKFLSLSRFTGIPGWGQWKDKQQDFGATGGALFDLVVHDIDYASWVCGDPDSIIAQCLPGKLSNHDYVSALWQYNGNGLHVKIEGGNIFHTAFPFQASFAARFEQASILYSSRDPENIILTTDTETTLIPAGDANDGFQAEIDYFAYCLEKNQPPEKCTPESALQSIHICHQHIKKSIQ